MHMSPSERAILMEISSHGQATTFNVEPLGEDGSPGEQGRQAWETDLKALAHRGLIRIEWGSTAGVLTVTLTDEGAALLGS